jgi:hypothetical protein
MIKLVNKLDINLFNLTYHQNFQNYSIFLKKMKMKINKKL